MSRVIECDICGDTYDKKSPRGRLGSKFARIDIPYRYRVWRRLPWNADRDGFVRQDVCWSCRLEFEEAVKLLKEKHEDDTEGTEE